MDEVQEFDAVGHWTLKRLTPANEPHAAGTLIDHSGSRRVGEIVLARRAARVNLTVIGPGNSWQLGSGRAQQDDLPA